MNNWVLENWLALYGAVVGSIALIVNFSRFVHAIGKDKVKLKVIAKDHPNKTENILELSNPQSRELGGGQQPFLPIYQIQINNVGNVDAHIESACVICSDKSKVHVLIKYPHDQCMYGSIEQVGTVLIKPKTSSKMNVYLHRGKEAFNAKTAEISDGTGKKWKVKI